MKKFFMIAVMAVAALTASAQQEAGTLSIKPMVGINISSTNMEVAGAGEYTGSKVGLTAGVDFTYQLSDPFALSAGVMYGQWGAAYKDDSKYKFKEDAISIPVLANYYICQGLAIKAGLSFNFITSAKVTDGDNDVDMKDYMKTFELMVPVGLSYEYSNFILDARYNIGVTDIIKDNNGDAGHNRGFQVTLGYKINL